MRSAVTPFFGSSPSQVSCWVGAGICRRAEQHKGRGEGGGEQNGGGGGGGGGSGKGRKGWCIVVSGILQGVNDYPRGECMGGTLEVFDEMYMVRANNVTPLPVPTPVCLRVRGVPD